MASTRRTYIRLLSLFCAALLTAFCLMGNFAALAEDEESEEPLKYSINSSGNAYTVSGVNDYTLTSIAVPATHEDLPVTAIGDNAFRDWKKLTSITLPDSIKSIGSYAFYGCRSLTSVSLAKGLTSLGEYAFAGCSALTTITLPATVDSIGGGVFMNCTKLADIRLASGNADFVVVNKVLFNSDQTVLICCPAAVSGSYSVPSTVTSIGNGAFAGCTGLTGVTLSSALINVSSLAFENCSGLTTITIPAKVTRLALDAFDGCTALTAVNVNTSNTVYASSGGVVLSSLFLPYGQIRQLYRSFYREDHLFRCLPQLHKADCCNHRGCRDRDLRQRLCRMHGADCRGHSGRRGHLGG